MSVEDIYKIVFDIVEEKHQQDLRNLQAEAKEMLRTGSSPSEVDKYENKRKKELNIEYRAYTKTALAVEIFVKSNFKASDVEIAQIISEAREINENIPSLARSSVGRYLTNPKIAVLYGQEIYIKILEERKNNLMEAKSKGGKAFAQNNVAIKDEIGHFQGSYRK